MHLTKTYSKGVGLGNFGHTSSKYIISVRSYKVMINVIVMVSSGKEKENINYERLRKRSL